MLVGPSLIVIPSAPAAAHASQPTNQVPTTTFANTQPANSPAEDDGFTYVFDNDWIEFILLTPVTERADVPIKPGSLTIANMNWDNLSGHYEPQLLAFASRPQMLTSFDQIPSGHREKVQAVWQEIQGGAIKYETWQYWENCIKNSNPDCGTTKYATASPPLNTYLCAISVQVYGGVPWWETVNIKIMESNNHGDTKVTNKTSGAKGLLQIKDWFMRNWGAYSGADAYDWCDPHFTASNYLVDENVRLTSTQADYAHEFRGQPCADLTNCKYVNPAGTYGYNGLMWNNHYGESNAVYLLGKQFETLWRSQYP